MYDFKEKRVWLIKMQSRLTATNAYMVDNSFIPKVNKILDFDDGFVERKDIGRTRFLMILADVDTLNSCLKVLKYVSSYTDITEQIVDGNYEKIVKHFDVEKFYRLYENDYLNNCSVSFATARIKEMESKSRYIDHQILFLNNERL